MNSGASAPLIPTITPAPTDFARVDEGSLLPENHHSPELAQYAETFNTLVAYLNTEKFKPGIIDSLKVQIYQLMPLKTNQDLSDQFFKIVTNCMSETKISKEEIDNITENLFKLNFEAEIQQDIETHDAIKLLLQLFLQYKIYYSEKYFGTHNNLVGFKQHYKLTRSENIFRHAIGLNAGLGSGNTIYGIATTILLSVPVMAISGLVSIAVCGVIMSYFLSAYTDEDKDLTVELTNQENKIRLFANTEAEARLQCYKKILKIRTLYLQGVKDKNFDVKKLNISDNMLNFLNSTYPLNTRMLDEVIDESIENLPEKASATAEANNISLNPKSSIYLRLFHSKYWGPVLSFFGAVGTVFGVTKTILAVAGVVTLAGSASLLPLVIAGGAIFFSMMFALKHWHFNRKSESRKKGFDTFRSEHIDLLQIRSEKLKRTNEKFKTIISDVKTGISASLLKTENPQVAALSKRRMSVANDVPQLAINTAGSEHLSTLSVFKSPPLITDDQVESSLNNLSKPETDRIVSASPR